MKPIIADKLKEWRQKNNITQKDLALRLGVTFQAISKWEREECYPDILHLPVIAEVLECTINDLFVM